MNFITPAPSHEVLIVFVTVLVGSQTLGKVDTLDLTWMFYSIVLIYILKHGDYFNVSALHNI